MRAAVLLVLAVAAFNFVCMPGEFLDGDPAAWREEARSLLLSRELSVPAGFAAQFGEPGQYFVRNEADGRYYSKYGVMNSLMALPPLWVQAASGHGLPEPGTYPSLLLANLWNIALCAALAALIYALAGDYTRRVSVRVLLVVGTLYCSALWFYQRAQSSEIYQAVFFAAFFLCLMRFLRTLPGRGALRLQPGALAWLGAAWLFAACLLFTRVLFGLLLPVVFFLAAYAALAGRSRHELRAAAPRLAAALLLPPLAAVALLAWINHAKFGAPWLTGYHQWRPELVLPGARLVDGLWGFLFSPRFSLFLHYPLLVFALLGARRFWHSHRIDAIAALAVFVPFLLFVSATPVWAGEAGYGPRYLLFMVPVLSLPALGWFDAVIDRRDTLPGKAWAAAALACLACSAYLQVQVNRVGFLTYYAARSALEAAYTEAGAAYFHERNMAVICADLIRHRDHLEALPYFVEFKRRVSPEFAEGYRENLRRWIERGNWYWTSPRRG
jgi:hypothetical protein